MTSCAGRRASRSAPRRAPTSRAPPDVVDGRAPRLPRADARPRARPAHDASTSCTTTASTTCRSRWPRRSSVPVVTTLHTPPIPWLESALRARPRRRPRFAAVSAVHRPRLVARGRQHARSSTAWTPTRWPRRARRRAGRVVGPAGPREGARTWRSTRPAGPASRSCSPDRPRTAAYFDAQVAPRLGRRRRLRRPPRPARALPSCSARRRSPW